MTCKKLSRLAILAPILCTWLVGCAPTTTTTPIVSSIGGPLTEAENVAVVERMKAGNMSEADSKAVWARMMSTAKERERYVNGCIRLLTEDLPRQCVRRSPSLDTAPCKTLWAKDKKHAREMCEAMILRNETIHL